MIRLKKCILREQALFPYFFSVMLILQNET